MLVDRRSVIKHFAVIAGGVVFLPACVQGKGKTSRRYDHLDIKADDEELLAAVADTLIPKTDTPGAREMNAHLYALTMVDDCYEEGAQKDFMKGMGELKDLCQKRFNQSFVNCTVLQREEILNEIEQSQEKNALTGFYKSMKSLTIDAYLTSQYVMTKLLPYELVPARWHGCVPATKNSTKLI